MYARVDVGTDAVVVLHSGHGAFVLANRGTDPIYLGTDAEVTTETGFLLDVDESLPIAATSAKEVVHPMWAIAESGPQSVHILGVL